MCKKREKLQFTKQFRHLFLQKKLLTHFFYLSTLCGSRRGHWHLYGGTAGHCHLLRPSLQDQEVQEDRLGDHCGRSAGTDHCGRSVRGFFVDHSTWIEKKNPSIDFETLPRVILYIKKNQENIFDIFVL